MHIDLPERRFYCAPNQNSYSAKVMMSATEAPEFPATYTQAGSPLANMWVHLVPNVIGQGAPSIACYLDAKPDAKKQVNMTYFLEDNKGLAVSSEGDCLLTMLGLFVRKAVEEMTQTLQAQGTNFLPDCKSPHAYDITQYIGTHDAALRPSSAKWTLCIHDCHKGSNAIAYSVVPMSIYCLRNLEFHAS